MMREMDLASEEQIDRMLGIYQSLDVNHDGVLNALDIRRSIMRRRPPGPEAASDQCEPDWHEVP